MNDKNYEDAFPWANSSAAPWTVQSHDNISESLLDINKLIDELKESQWHTLYKTAIYCIRTAKNDSLLWQLHLLAELQLWHGFKGWCNVSPLSQPSMGNVGNAALVEYMNFALSTKILATVSHFNHTVVTLVVSEIDCVRHLPGSWSRFPHWQSCEHLQGHYNWVVMEIFMPWWQQVTPSQMFSD